MNAVPAIAVVTAIISAGSWIYRFIDEYSRYQELLFYILVPTIAWLLFAGPLFMLRSQTKALRILAMILLVPATGLWVVSILVGVYGLKIH